MRRQISLLLVGLLIAISYLPLLSVLPVKAQPFTSSGTRFGMNVTGNGYGDAAYTDIFLESFWSTSTKYNANNYPVGPNATGAVINFFLNGDNPGQQICDFYGEGIFDIVVSGNFTTNQSWPWGGTSRGVV